ncbi:MAG: DUF3185 family protein [Planctomycetes bacterium]|nr:DUF3185 family protein [Planctomycetota bacterium]MBI3844816.1 DUF3185 family protein [Planctomycetota bacterium]
MNRSLGIALLVVGVILLVWGINATDSVTSDISRFFTGSPTNKSIWLVIGGTAAAVTGLVMTLGSRRGGPRSI